MSNTKTYRVTLAALGGLAAVLAVAAALPLEYAPDQLLATQPAVAVDPELGCDRV